MKNLFAATAFATILIVGFAPLASAAPITFDAVLAGSNEFPSNASPGTGFALVTIDTVTNLMTVNITFSGLTSPSTAAHIHCCLPSPLLAATNVGVATEMPAFPNFPLGATSGTDNAILDMSMASSYNPAFVTAHGGTASGAEAALFAGIENEETYLNIHTVNFGGGEIRGFLVPVPEPVTWTLFGAGLAGAIAMRRRKAKA